ncbi:hypothetical protein ACYFX5_05660 [Bremerella sp. T1]|uniref:hypothetical protein n=1 Tax=Bremerella sp. TYQ1 TaxID=3119568 RepID=UPI001CCEDBED|nr:hypothetical protein [Bremerella volcania]UBM37745.1 hypothetical protein LA756_07600 [Bremerella volcania]
MRATTLWTALTLSTVFFAATANAEKTTYAKHTGQKTIGQESSAVEQFTSGDWRVERQPEGQPGQHMPPGMNPYVAMDPYGQMMMPGMAAGYAPQGVMPAGYGMPMAPGYGPGAPGQPMMDPNVMPAGHWGGHGCQSCGGAGCQHCMGGHHGHLGKHRGNGCCDACGGAGCGSCCGLCGGGVYCGFSRGIGNAWDLSEYGGRSAPRYADVVVDATLFIYEAGNNPLVLTSQNAANNPVLSTDDADFTNQGGIRLGLNRTFTPGTYLEFSYLGIGNWASTQSVTGSGNLFSAFSGFGVDPVGGYAETDNSDLQMFSTSNRFDSFELNMRRFFTSPGGWWHSGWWVGFRYVRVDDDAVYNTVGSGGSLEYTVDADNDMFGVQFGMDSALRLTNRWTLSMFGEIGVYGNRANQDSTIVLNGGANTFEESAASRRASMVVEGGFMSTFKVIPRGTLRAGYQVVYIDGIALGSDSFNFETGGASTLGTALAGRSAFVNDNGNAVYHGPTVGFEYMW